MVEKYSKEVVERSCWFALVNIKFIVAFYRKCAISYFLDAQWV